MPTAVVHVGCDDGRSPGWLELVPSSQRIDATGAHPATVPATGDGPWFVLVPSVAAAAADRPDHDGLLAQSERVAAALAARTAPVLLVGHGGAGAATVRATGLGNVAALVDDVVTVGTPWGPVATTAFETDLSGDALRLLTALAPTEVPAVPDTALALGSSPERQALDLLWRSRTEPAQLPSALAVGRDPLVRVHACFATPRPHRPRACPRCLRRPDGPGAAARARGRALRSTPGSSRGARPPGRRRHDRRAPPRGQRPSRPARRRSRRPAPASAA